MFSSLSSFLPSSLQGNQENREVQPTPAPQQQQEEEVDAQKQADNMPGAKKKSKKDKAANETFIFVRPPPAKSNHPLNLQVQLVPPSRTDRSPGNRQSFDGSTVLPPEQQDQDGSNLTRTDSTRSTEGSMYSSNTSISSYASSGSTSGRRMIIPLYNLQAHNVMTNTVVDAGTDAKVARFQKRGLEIIGLAVLEPIEVWGEAPIVSSASARTSIDGGNGSTFSHKELGILPPTPGSPSIPPDIPASVSSNSKRPSNATAPVQDPSLLSPMPPTGAKKMFGKIFRKNTRPPSINLPPGGDAMATSSHPTINVTSARYDKRMSAASTMPGTPLPSAALPSAGLETPTTATGVAAPVLGVQPMMSSPTHPPHGRPGKYVWVVRRWLKGEGSLLGGMMGRLNNGKDALGLGAMGFGNTMSGMGQVEVRFEWTRGMTGRRREKELKDGKRVSPPGTTGQGSSNGSQSRRASVIVSQSSKEHLHTPSKKDKRLSGLSQRSISTHTGTSDEHDQQEEDGDESDPEDSETPWSCAVSVQRVVHPSSARQSSSVYSRPSMPTSPTAYQQPDQGVRLKVATLSPTPHHPKVVSMLKVPFPLPDIEVDKMAVRRRVLTPTGIARPGTSTGHEGLILTAEEIKDVVSCTGLWLVVREGFGGVGRVNRKGDGWKIRG